MAPLDQEVMGYRVQAVILVSIFIAIVLTYELVFQNQAPSNEANENQFFSEKIPILLEPHVRSNDFSSVKEKIRKIYLDGSDQLQIITDFDRTLSKYSSNGELTKSSFGIFATASGVPTSYVQGAAALYGKYGVIEEDPKMSVQDKIPYMEQWWDEYRDLVKDIPLDNNTLDQAVIANNIAIRDGAHMAFSQLNENSVPILVFSAGLGDVISSVVRLNNLNFKNVHVISNFFSVNNGRIDGFMGESIHAFNKNEHAVQHTDYFKDLSHRGNVILLGDSIGDSFMDEGIPGNGTTLKIGFLNSKVDEFLPIFLNHFDLVLIEDQTMDVLNDILSYVLH